MYEHIKEQARLAAEELLDLAVLEKNQIFIIGCSSSEITGGKIGKASVYEAAQAVFDGIYPLLKEKNIFLAAQCCEHLNRAIITEKNAAILYGLEPVSVIPYPHAGGSFATAAYRGFENPVAVEKIAAHAGMDIGDTLIGMHLKPVAVPLRLTLKKIGEANLVAARTRPKYIGGERAKYE